MRIIAFIEDYKVVKKILDYLGIFEFKRNKPPPRMLSVADTFDDYRCDDEILSNVVDEKFYTSSNKSLCSHLLSKFSINKFLVFKDKQYQFMTF